MVWFVALPFAQGVLRSSHWQFPYPKLFHDAWRNALLMMNCVVFTGAFWLLLMLWAGLFKVLDIHFFYDLFTNHKFVYPATAMAVSFAASLESVENTTLTTMHRYMLAFKTRLLPLAAVILLLFLGALLGVGLQPVWKTGVATPLMICLQWAMIVLTNAAWQDGQQPMPFAKLTQWMIRAALALLPVLAALCIWSLSLRINQYGWTTDRVWAALLVALSSVYAIGYALAALRQPAFALISRVNVVAAWVIIVLLVSVHTPLLDPSRIAATSQVARLLSDKVSVENFDYDYLRFELGRAGNDELKDLMQVKNHPNASGIRERAEISLARNQRDYNPKPQQTQIKDVVERIKLFPAGSKLEPSFIEYLDGQFKAGGWQYELSTFHNPGEIVMLATDLGGDAKPEYILIGTPYTVFSQTPTGWSIIGNIIFAPQWRSGGIVTAVKEAKVTPVVRSWKDLRFDNIDGQLNLKRE